MRYAVLFFALTLAACGQTPQTRREYVREYDRPPAIEEAILKKQVVKGMSKKDVRASWGTPGDIYHKGASAPTQWCYNQRSRCIYFENGKVTDWKLR